MASFPKQNVYGYPSPSSVLFPAPISAKRAPTTADISYPIGQVWVYVANNAPYILTSVVSNSATWQLIEASGGAGVFSSLTVTGTSTLTGTTNINTSGSAVTSIGVGGTGAVNIGNATGNTVISAGNLTATSGNIVASAGNISATAGSISAGTTVSATTTMTAGTGITATTGNITATNGNVVLSTAATFVQLPGPIKVMSGAGAPANGLAAEAGDLYIRTDPAGATSRIYVATGAGAWTNVTCAG